MMHAEHGAPFSSGYKEWVRTVYVDKKESPGQTESRRKRKLSSTL